MNNKCQNPECTNEAPKLDNNIAKYCCKKCKNRAKWLRIIADPIRLENKNRTSSEARIKRIEANPELYKQKTKEKYERNIEHIVEYRNRPEVKERSRQYKKHSEAAVQIIPK